MTIKFAQQWPILDTERALTCPYCDSAERVVVYERVRDWSFQCAPGEWTYWDCTNCNSLYLDPRPTPKSIGSAYADYYTHGTSRSISVVKRMKLRLRNECLSHIVKTSIEPRLHLPKMFNPVLRQIADRVHLPFDLSLLVHTQKGKLVDVGCGDGHTVAWAKQLGWDAMGIEIDPAAVCEARSKNLNVLEGTYEMLSSLTQRFDCIVCSHVLEHVHDPRALLRALKKSLKPGGLLLLTLPNSLSALRHHFGADWRGLEAPRHISIPSEHYLLRLLEQLDFSVRSYADNQLPTAEESYRIQRRSLIASRSDRKRARQLDIIPMNVLYGNDFIKLACSSPSSTETDFQ